MLKGLEKRMQYSFDTRFKSGGNRSVLALPPEVKFYQPKEGKNRICILPYKVKTDKHPLVKLKPDDFQVGDYDYVLDVTVHRGIGMNNVDVVCLRRTYEKQCPLCEEGLRLKDLGDESAGDFIPTRRVFYNVIDMDGNPNEIMVFSTSYKLFERKLISAAQIEGEDEQGEGGFLNFADIEEGKILIFDAIPDSFGKVKYFEFENFRFKDRNPLPKNILDKVLSLDEFLIVRDYETIINEFMEGGVMEKEEIKEAVEEDKQEKQEVKEKETETEEKPATQRKNVRIDNNEKKEEKTSKKCPYGHKFGEANSYSECLECEVWDECEKEQG